MDEHEPVPGPAVAVHPEPATAADAARPPLDAAGDHDVIDLRDGAPVVVHRRGADAVAVVPLVDALPAWPTAPEPEVAAVVDVAPEDVVEVAPDPGTGAVAPEDGRDAAGEPAPATDRLPVARVHSSPARRTDEHLRAWVHEPEPRWRTTQLVGAVVAAVVVGLLAGLAAATLPGGGGGTRTGAAPAATAGAAVTASGAAGAGTTPSSGVDARRASAATRAPDTGPGSYAQPLPVGARATLADAARGDLDVVVIGVDDDPWPELRAANAFNVAPPANLRSIMVTVAVIYRAGTEQRTFDGVSGALVFSAFGSAGREHRDAEYPVVAPLPLDRSADLLDGGSVYGNLVFAVEADSRDVSLRVQRTGCAATCGEVWFALR